MLVRTSLLLLLLVFASASLSRVSFICYQNISEKIITNKQYIQAEMGTGKEKHRVFLRQYDRGPDLLLGVRVGCSEETTVDKKGRGEELIRESKWSKRRSSPSGNKYHLVRG